MSTTNEPPAHRHMFKPGEHVPEDGLHRFEPYLERKENEPDYDYARRLDKADLAVAVTSDDARDLVKYRRLLAEARHNDLPVVMLTAESANQAVQIAEQVHQTSELRDPAKLAAYIEAERARAKPFVR